MGAGAPFGQRRPEAPQLGSRAMSMQAASVGEARPPAKYDRLIAAAKAIPPAATLVVHPCDESSLRGTVEATEAGLIKPTLVGPEPKIRDAASKHGIDISRFEI